MFETEHHEFILKPNVIDLVEELVWHHDQPFGDSSAIPTYLVSLAIHPYTRYTDFYAPLDGGDPMPVEFYIYPDHVGVVETNYALTVPMIAAFAQAYGEQRRLEIARALATEPTASTRSASESPTALQAGEGEVQS